MENLLQLLQINIFVPSDYYCINYWLLKLHPEAKNELADIDSRYFIDPCFPDTYDRINNDFYPC